MFASAGPTTPVAEIEIRERLFRFTVWDDSISFVAKPVKLRTRAGKDYFVLRVTLPKDVCARLKASPEDYLLLRAKVAQWYHMVDWKSMPEAWERLPPELKVILAQSGLPVPETIPALPGPTSPAGGLTATTTLPAYTAPAPTASP